MRPFCRLRAGMLGLTAALNALRYTGGPRQFLDETQPGTRIQVAGRCDKVGSMTLISSERFADSSTSCFDRYRQFDCSCSLFKRVHPWGGSSSVKESVGPERIWPYDVPRSRYSFLRNPQFSFRLHISVLYICFDDAF
jgi:hypothetical protein